MSIDPQEVAASTAEKLIPDPHAALTVYCDPGGQEAMLAAFSLRGDVVMRARFGGPANELWTREATLARTQAGRTDPSVRVVELARVVTAAVADSAGDSWEELVPRAAHLLDAYATAHPEPDQREFVAEEAMLDFGHGVDAAYLEVATCPDGCPATEKRAAMVRLAMATLAWLTVDQAVRGKAEVDNEMAFLDETGRPE